MLLFDFYCEKCGLFELILDSKSTKECVFCPTCNSQVKRLFSAPAFYRTFSGNRHHLLRKAEKGVEPVVVKKGTGDPLEARLSSSHSRHIHKGCASCDSGYPPWMLKH
jgi:putative FmdB family regulatory protein